MNNFQITSTGIAVTLAIVVALAMLFLGPNLFAPFSPQQAEPEMASSTLTFATTTMEQQPLPEELPTELSGSDSVTGTGAEAVAGSRVTVNYVGMLPDGTVFDASARHGQPFTFTLGAGEVIQGWDMGVAGMKVGGQRRLIVPPAFGYGAQGIPGVIPANATLIFDVELVAVQ
jgi:FKBP-type peptidyl-prolyl cis-trans isomerase